MRIPWGVRGNRPGGHDAVTLSDLYDADLRKREPFIVGLAMVTYIPHPLKGVVYADGQG